MVHVLIMSGYGINCETESAHAFDVAGATSDIVHINDLISGKKKMADYDIMFFPGGFSYGDDTGSGNAFAQKLKNNLWDDMNAFIDAGKPILGVCNGFQIMTRLGLFALPESEGGEYGKQIHSLAANTQNRYECRWVHIQAAESNCIFTKNISMTNLPIAHGEGRFFCDDVTLKALQDGGQIVFTYVTEDGAPAAGTFPDNPNGSFKDIAGICDRSGRIMGMMPHPERALYSTGDPLFHVKAEKAKREGKEIPEIIESNLMIFKNAVAFAKDAKGAKDTKGA